MASQPTGPVCITVLGLRAVPTAAGTAVVCATACGDPFSGSCLVVAQSNGQARWCCPSKASTTLSDTNVSHLFTLLVTAAAWILKAAALWISSCACCSEETYGPAFAVLARTSGELQLRVYRRHATQRYLHAYTTLSCSLADNQHSSQFGLCLVALHVEANVVTTWALCNHLHTSFLPP